MLAWILVVFTVIVFVSGTLGGIVSAILINNRSLLSDDMAEDAGVHRKRRGEVLGSYFLNGFLGGVAACVSWLAYGPYSTLYIIGQGQAAPEVYGVTAVALATAFFIGMSGAKWLQSERDKGRWQAAAYDAARTDADYGLARNLSLASSDQAAQIAAKAASETQPSRADARPRARSDREPARGAEVT